MRLTDHAGRARAALGRLVLGVDCEPEERPLSLASHRQYAAMLTADDTKAASPGAMADGRMPERGSGDRQTVHRGA